jgi:hypothetical protein
MLKSVLVSDTLPSLLDSLGVVEFDSHRAFISPAFPVPMESAGDDAGAALFL